MGKGTVMEEDLKARLEKTRARLEHQAMRLKHNREPKSPEEQFGNWCRHFNGMLQEHCSMGIAYEAVRDPDTGCLPCLRDRGCTERCPSASFPSPSEVAIYAELARTAIAGYFIALSQDRCPQCQEQITTKRLEGHDIFAMPCDHQLYQG